MARPNPIRAIMAQPLPSLTYQRRKSFRPSDIAVSDAYDLINRYVFDGVLHKPNLTQGTIKQCWGFCSWEPEEQNSGSWCQIKVSDKWFCTQWFMNTLAHEMVHQYQWDIHRWEHLNTHGRDIYQKSKGHGPSFHAWRERFIHYGLFLKTSFGQRRWLKNQDFTKC